MIRQHYYSTPHQSASNSHEEDCRGGLTFCFRQIPQLNRCTRRFFVLWPSSIWSTNKSQSGTCHESVHTTDDQISQTPTIPDTCEGNGHTQRCIQPSSTCNDISRSSRWSFIRWERGENPSDTSGNVLVDDQHTRPNTGWYCRVVPTYHLGDFDDNGSICVTRLRIKVAVDITVHWIYTMLVL